MAELLRWLNGWVYSFFGADGLLIFQAHPFLYAAATAGLVLGATGLATWWVQRRLSDLRRRIGLTVRLALTPAGRRCLRLAGAIRRGGARLNRAIRRGIDERSERRALLQLLERFTQRELLDVLEQAQRLVARGDDAREARLRAALDQQTHRWSAAQDEAERARLQEAIAATRHQLARVSADNQARDQHLSGLAEAAQAVQSLEEGLGALQHARSRALPEFSTRVSAVAQQVEALQQAYRELEHRR